MQATNQYVKDGYHIVVDVDLEKFFDRVKPDILMDRLAKGLPTREFRGLFAGIFKPKSWRKDDDGAFRGNRPQGTPLSPLLANVLLDEVDKELVSISECVD